MLSREGSTVTLQAPRPPVKWVGSMVPTPAPLWEWGLGRMVAQCDRNAPRVLWDGWGWCLQNVAQCDHGSHTARSPDRMGVGVYNR